MPFQISALPAARFHHLFGADERKLDAHGAKRVLVDSDHAFPCRVSLEDASIGETVILLNYEHQAATTPYRSRFAIYVREHAEEAALGPGEVPDQLRRRLLSVRAFDADDMLIDGDVVDGKDFERLALLMLANPNVSYLHVHNAKYGCYAARVDRVLEPV